MKINKVSSLTSIPVELLCHILLYVNPIDLIVLRRTEKRIAFLTKDRNIWLEQLRRICQEHGILEQTFPFATMDLGNLEHACLTPYLFGNALSKGSVTGRTRETTIVFPFEVHIEESHLVPGGRYLLTFCSGDIYLWDLGYVNPNSAIQASAVASFDLSEYSLSSWPKIIATEPASDGQTLSMFLEDIDDHEWQISVFQINPLATKPKFTLHRSLKGSSSYVKIQHSTVSQGIWAMRHNDMKILVLWDYIHDKVSTWDIRSPGHEMFISDGHLLLCSANGMQMWKLPDFPDDTKSFVPVDVAGEIVDYPHHFYEELREPAGDDEIIVPCGAWPRGKGRPALFSVLRTLPDGSAIDFYSFDPILNNDKSSPNMSITLRSTLPMPFENGKYDTLFMMPQTPGRFIDRWFVQAYQLGATDDIHVAIVDSLDFEQEPRTIALHSDVSQYSFCPVSGRSCLTKMERSEDENDIYVVDFCCYNSKSQLSGASSVRACRSKNAP
ncbi:hypothetical protein H0H93_006810 [Arthromyces matolae]|nr:hypothetical protein H0H93_006810 [Arthromyces matolae]